MNTFFNIIKAMILALAKSIVLDIILNSDESKTDTEIGQIADATNMDRAVKCEHSGMYIVHND
jgi:hypothetical protein